MYDDIEDIAFLKTGKEWELFGNLALRLNNIEYAKKSFELAQMQTISLKSLQRLVEIYSIAGDIKKAFEFILKSLILLEKAFMEESVFNW